MRDRDRKWQTKPLECWAKFKELRLDHYKDVATAKERGKFLVTGSAGTPFPLLNGFGDDFVFLGGEGYGGSIGTNPSASIDYMTATEARGYTREMCGYMRNYWGSMFSDHWLFTGGPFPKPDFCFSEHFCDVGHGKWYQVVAEHFGVPLYAVDLPFGPIDDRLDAKIDYIASQLADIIEQIKKQTGREFDDERFIASSRTYFETESTWSEVCLLNAAVPAPLDLKTIFALMPVAITLRDKPEGLAAIRELRDEVKDRVARQIGATELERIRLVTDLVPPWSAIKLFRAFQDRGVVFVGIWVYTVNGGDVEYHADGTVTPSRTPEQRGFPMKTRDDALRVWGRWLVDHPFQRGMGDADDSFNQLLALYRHWKGDGIVMHYNRGCKPCLNFRPEVKNRLENEGIPVSVYESNFSDVRDTDVGQIMKRWDAFVEVLEPMISGR